MRLQICSNTVSLLKTWYSERNPRLRFGEYLKIVREGIRINKLVAQRDFLEKIQKKGLYTQEMITTAKRNRGLNAPASNKRQKKEQKRLLALRIKEKLLELKKCQQVWRKNLKAVEEGLTRQARREFNQIKSRELKRTWDIEKDHKNEKIKCLTQGQEIPQVYMGITIGDRLLKEKFQAPDPEVVVLGGIVPTANMIAFMKIPVKTRIHPKVDQFRHEVECEATADKERWTVQDMEQHGEETIQARLSRKE